MLGSFIRPLKGVQSPAQLGVDTGGRGGGRERRKKYLETILAGRNNESARALACGRLEGGAGLEIAGGGEMAWELVAYPWGHCQGVDTRK